MTDADDNRIGGTDPGSKNLISGNDEYGITIDATSSGNTVASNIIGANASGTAEVHNGHNGLIFGDITGAGVRVDGPSNFIGVIDGGNLISGNNHGITVSGADNIIRANRIGLNAAGTGALRNRKYGVFVGAPGTVIGGGLPTMGNVISGNTLQGVYVTGAAATGVSIELNYIGTNVTGTAAVSNGQAGIEIRDGAQGAIRRNIISGNSNAGLRIETDGVGVFGNRIGIQVAADLPLGNSGAGVSIAGSNNIIGGPNVNEPNTIAYNNGAGVAISSGTQNIILESAFYGNTGLGIDLESSGPTANDALDADEGANRVQNFPVITGANTVITTGTFHSRPSAFFTLKFYASPSCAAPGEGRSVRATATAFTDGSGNATFTTSLNSIVAGDGVTVTATDSFGNTSEFSACVTVVSTAPEPEAVAAWSDSGSRLRQPLPGVRREGIGRLGRAANLQK
jgi:titin